MNEQEQVKAGVGVMILRGGKVLLGLRKGGNAAGEHSFPGGRLEHLESFEDCARRETLEECGVEIKNVRFLYLANIKKYAPQHYVHIGLIADWESGEPRVQEPKSCGGWEWYGLDELPLNADITLMMGVESHRTGRNYFDA
jgi:8-oxo-dGTP diphosphatase